MVGLFNLEDVGLLGERISISSWINALLEGCDNSCFKYVIIQLLDALDLNVDETYSLVDGNK